MRKSIHNIEYFVTIVSGGEGLMHWLKRAGGGGQNLINENT